MLAPRAQRIAVLGGRGVEAREKHSLPLRELRAGNLHFTNKNLDTGLDTGPGTYELADKTYAKLLDKLADKKFASLTPALQANILEFYSRADRAAIPPKTLDQLEQLKQVASNRGDRASQDPAPLDHSDQ